MNRLSRGLSLAGSASVEDMMAEGRRDLSKELKSEGKPKTITAPPPPLPFCERNCTPFAYQMLFSKAKAAHGR